jgi:hypothetical protein
MGNIQRYDNTISTYLLEIWKIDLKSRIMDIPNLELRISRISGKYDTPVLNNSVELLNRTYKLAVLAVP